MSSVRDPDLRLTYKEYVLFPNDGNRHEIIDGDHYMNPAPSTYHQTVSKRLQYALYSQIELLGLGTVFNAPIDLQLSPYDVVQPDLIVLAPGSKAKITPTKIIGPPELVVEILSPSTADNDRDLKRRLYERSHVAEYWIVDPFEHRIVQLVLQGTAYHELPVAAAEVSFTVIPTVKILLADIW